MGCTRIGKRLDKKIKIKESKVNIKEFYKILKEIDKVVALLEEEDVTIDNLDSKVAIYSEMTMGSMERIIFKNKLKLYEETDIK